MKKRAVIFFIGIFVIAVLFKVFVINNPNIVGKIISFRSSESTKTESAKIEQKPSSGGVVVVIDKNNFPLYLKSQQMIKELPKNAAILIKLYNFDKGERAWEESYVINQGNVEKGNLQNPDITIFFDSKYIKEANSIDFCSLIKKAKTNGDLGYETGISKASLLLKYGSMIKYKNCF